MALDLSRASLDTIGRTHKDHLLDGIVLSAAVLQQQWGPPAQPYILPLSSADFVLFENHLNMSVLVLLQSSSAGGGYPLVVPPGKTRSFSGEAGLYQALLYPQGPFRGANGLVQDYNPTPPAGMDWVGGYFIAGWSDAPFDTKDDGTESPPAHNVPITTTVANDGNLHALVNHAIIILPRRIQGLDFKNLGNTTLLFSYAVTPLQQQALSPNLGSQWGTMNFAGGGGIPVMAGEALSLDVDFPTYALYMGSGSLQPAFQAYAGTQAAGAGTSACSLIVWGN